ncbi:MAG: M3 family metallopeptidase [Epsilonproteobacteria bacterium]|nr:M3 family metallopeptidase [Campylobacterota bacterium]
MQLEDFKIDNIKEFPQKLKELLDRQLKDIKSITDSDKNSYKEVLKPMQDLDNELELFFTPLSHLNSVKNSKETQKAYEESLPQLSKFDSQITQNEKLFEKIKNITSNELEEKKVIENNIKEFILSGAELPTKEKKELEKINIKLSELSNKFSQNLLDANNAYELIIKDEKDVVGIPDSDLELAKTTIDGKSVYKFTLQIPSYLAYMTYGINRAYREELYRAYSTRAPQNAQIIDEILSLRDKKAKLLGFENYTDLSIETKDAPSATEVIEFLNRLAKLAKPQAIKELDELKAFAFDEYNIQNLQPFDVAYYSEKLKKAKFDFDENMTKPYFEQSKVLNGMLDIVSTLFKVEFKPASTPTWDSRAKVFDIYKDSKLSGRVYFDLEARKDKRGGAWMHNWQTHFIDTKNQQHLPAVFIVCNFPASTKTTPSLLRHNDVVTLFHEMGHGIHHLFSKCHEHSVSGVNGTAWDVVEFPSQFLENFAYEKEILKKFAYHYESGEPMSDELLDKIKDSKNFQSALGILRQVEFSLFDILLHQKLYQGDEVQELLDDIRKETSLLKVPSYNRFQNGFGHIFSGGYAAGYYSYKWAEVLSADAFFECLDSNGSFNQEKADGYYNFILSRGSSEDMNILYKKWLGRDAKVESLLRLYGIES